MQYTVEGVECVLNTPIPKKQENYNIHMINYEVRIVLLSWIVDSNTLL